MTFRERLHKMIERLAAEAILAIARRQDIPPAVLARSILIKALQADCIVRPGCEDGRPREALHA